MLQAAAGLLSMCVSHLVADPACARPVLLPAVSMVAVPPAQLVICKQRVVPAAVLTLALTLALLLRRVAKAAAAGMHRVRAAGCCPAAVADRALQAVPAVAAAAAVDAARFEGPGVAQRLKPVAAVAII
jgi:hypothetical protein